MILINNCVILRKEKNGRKLGFVYICRKGRLLAMKGKLPDDELAELPAGWCVSRVEALHVPGLEAERHLLVFERQPKAG